MQHDLIKYDSERYECRACRQIWQSPPRSHCPGLLLYPKYGHEPLLTRLQLGYAGYEIAPRLLPAPVGCCRSNGKYQMLYDPSQAMRKQKGSRLRRTVSVTELFWPLRWTSFIEAYLQDDRFSHLNEVAEIAFHLMPFTPSEVQQWAGVTLHLAIAPCLVPVSLPAFSGTERAVLVKSIAAAYRKCRDGQ